MNRTQFFSCVSVLAVGIAAQAALAQTSSTAPSTSGGPIVAPGQNSTQAAQTDAASAVSPSSGAADIVVTANKREQSLNSVGLTIAAATGVQLANRGIAGPADLAKLVPGFTYTQSLYSTPVFTLRGIGLYDATFGAAPSVSVYTDQVPRNVPVMSDALDLDIERVEVLKGPQGTLFGQSSTGGAINYIVTKPTREFHAGVGASYERFNRGELSGFASGPITDDIQARLAVKGVEGGAWQHSISRPGDKNGATRKLEGRATVDIEPTSSIKIELMATGVRDHSDPLAPQYAGTNLDIYPNAAAAAGNPYAVIDPTRYAALTNPASPGYDGTLIGRQGVEVGRLNGADPVAAAGAAALLGTPIATNSRDAEFTQGLLGHAHNSYYQFSGHLDWDLGSNLKATYIAAIAKQKLDYNQDLDGTTAQVVDVNLFGNVKTFNQEVRLAYDSERFHGIVGATYDNVRTSQNNYFHLNDYSANDGLILLTLNNYTSKQHSYGIFGNGEYKLTPNFTVQGGIRYTDNRQSATYCYNDPASDVGQGAATLFGSALNSVPIHIAPGQCFPTSGSLLTGNAKSTLDPVHGKLNENNISYRIGANYKFDGGTLLYATVSQGYKAGIFSAIGASSTSQYTPAKQEKVIAYEAGFKAPLFDHKLQVNGAGFYYDYSNKQVRGREQDAIFGLLEKLLNIPKSYIWGLEGEIVARPSHDLTVSLSGTYLNSKVTKNYSATPDGLPVYNAEGYTGNFKGSELPYTPKFSGTIDAQQDFPLGDSLKGFVGGSVTYQGKENTTFHTGVLRADDFFIKGYALVDARIGVTDADGHWRVSAYARNLTGKTYTTAVSTYLDTLIRYRGKPSVYGLSASYNF